MKLNYEVVESFIKGYLDTVYNGNFTYNLLPNMNYSAVLKNLVYVDEICSLDVLVKDDSNECHDHWSISVAIDAETKDYVMIVNNGAECHDKFVRFRNGEYVVE